MTQRTLTEGLLDERKLTTKIPDESPHGVHRFLTVVTVPGVIRVLYN